MIPEEFFTWSFLTTYGGASLAVMAIVQFTKDLPGIRKIPTRLWAFLVAVIILVLAAVFTVTPIYPSDILLCVVNAVVVAMAAVGSYHTVVDIKDPVVIPEEKPDEEG